MSALKTTNYVSGQHLKKPRYLSFLLHGSNESGVDMRVIAHLYDLLKGTIFIYIRHVGISLYKSLEGNSKTEIK